jgi:hypothetical protein
MLVSKPDEDRRDNGTVAHYPPAQHRLLPAAIGVLILAVWVFLAGWSALVHAPVFDEPVQLMAGLGVWRFGRFDWYHVNPPLVKSVAALPVLAMHPRVPEKLGQPAPIARQEFAMAGQYVHDNGADIRRQIVLARWACLCFSLIGALACWRWAEALFGASSGLVALSLWCFSPYVLGHGPLIMNDVPAAAMGTAALYFFWRWLRRPGFRAVLAAGLALGLAELCKFTLLILYPILPLIWFLDRLARRRDRTWSDWLREAGTLMLIILISVYVVNCGYLFDGTCVSLQAFRFQTLLLTGCESPNSVPIQGANRFAGTWLGGLPVPIPAYMLQGIDTQRLDFERGVSSYLRGEWSAGGWWYYYLYALAIKLPLGTWLLVVTAIGMSCVSRRFSAAWRDEMVMLVPLVSILILVSSQSGFSVHSRYVIPALPFALIWTSKAARVFAIRPLGRGRVAMVAVVAAALTWSVGSSLAVYPHSLSYFNELVGGPRHGGEHLQDSNVDWGQDLYFLKEWLDDHPDVHLDGLAYFGFVSPRLAGIPQTPFPMAARDSEHHNPDGSVSKAGPKPGWYALSVSSLYDHSRQYRLFLRFNPVASAGYSIYIYRITPDEANCVRRELGLPDLPREQAHES